MKNYTPTIVFNSPGLLSPKHGRAKRTTEGNHDTEHDRQTAPPQQDIETVSTPLLHRLYAVLERDHQSRKTQHTVYADIYIISGFKIFTYYRRYSYG